MAKAVIKGKLLRWGNSLGLRISKKDAQRLGLKEGTEISVTIENRPTTIDLSMFPIVRGSGTDGRDHDKILGEARWRELHR